MECPVCGDKTRVTCARTHHTGHKRRYRRCVGCGYAFVTAQAYALKLKLPPIGIEQITDHLPCGYAGHLAKSQPSQSIK